MNILEKLDRIDPRVIYLVLAVSLLIPVLKPLGLPINIDRELTQPVYNWIEGLKPGDIVIFDSAYGGGSDSELSPQLRAWFYHCMKKGVKVVGVSQWDTAPPLVYPVLTGTAAFCESKGISAKEGIDWVYVGMKGAVGTTGTTFRAMQDDFWKTCGNQDYNKKDFSQIPLMAQVKKWDKATIKGIICYSAGSPGLPTYTTYFPDQDLYVGDVAVQVAGTRNLLRSGQAKGIIPGLAGAAQYEKLIGVPGQGLKLMDAQSLGHLWVIVLVILGNVGYRLKMRAGTKRAA